LRTHKINHLGIAVVDLDRASRVYEALGLSVQQVVEVPEQNVRVAFIPIGDTMIELVQPTSSASTVATYLEKRGQGLHHVALEVEDIQAALAELTALGMRLIDQVPRQGAEGRIAFVHPASTEKVLIELVEPGP
jgi:methylmalonyl-CoA epimerase